MNKKTETGTGGLYTQTGTGVNGPGKRTDSRISSAFSRSKKAFIPFVTCGDPDLETTAELVKMLADSGAALIELGIPFSDPMAEGPVIQDASMRALEGGATVDRIFEMVRELRKTVAIPLVFMTYANIVFARDVDEFAAKCAEVGIDGLIIPDIPFEERDEFRPACERFGIELISMIAPSSKDRIAKIAREAKGFIYIVSSYGVTGVRESINSDVAQMVELVRANTIVPCAIGFGISSPEQAAKMSGIADGVIVGSAIMRIVAEHGKDCVPFVREFVKEIIAAI